MANRSYYDQLKEQVKQLEAEEKWILDALEKLRVQRGRLMYEGIKLDSFKIVLKMRQCYDTDYILEKQQALVDKLYDHHKTYSRKKISPKKNAEGHGNEKETVEPQTNQNDNEAQENADGAHGNQISVTQENKKKGQAQAGKKKVARENQEKVHSRSAQEPASSA